ncbi:MAG: response regulator transcription factor [Bacteroidetes bacterium]|nr:response regulator transcription factor [Bacteroidota bacterium]
MDKRIKVLIADDHPIFRKGLRQAIESDRSLVIVGEAGDGIEAYRLIEELRPDVAVLDIEMPGMTGLDIAKKIQKLSVAVDVIFLTMYKDEDMFNEALDLGVKGYVLKENTVEDIVNCIKVVAKGKYFLSPSISSYLVNRNERAKSLLRKKPELKDLTPTERKILKLIAENKTSKEIAMLLHISHRTVENHRLNICNKLDIHGSHALLRFALENKTEIE